MSSRCPLVCLPCVGAPDPELHAKIALLQQTLDSRDSVVKDTVEKMESGGIAQVLQQVSSWEQQAAAAERDLQDPEVQSILSAAGPLLGAHFALPDEGDGDEDGGREAGTREEGTRGLQAIDDKGGRYMLLSLAEVFGIALYVSCVLSTCAAPRPPLHFH